MGTSQSTIARLENGQTLPRTKTIRQPGSRAAIGGLTHQRAWPG
jgi:hypothetical protein